MLASLARLVSLFGVIGALVHASASRAADAAPGVRRPNVLFILSDDQRADTIHALGNELIETPALDALVRDGAVFTRAIAACPICVASRAEILSGCCGLRHPEANFNGRFTPDQVLWPEVMRRAGYETWYVGKWHTEGRPTARGYTASRGLFAGGVPTTAAGVDYAGRPVTGYVGWVFQDDEGHTFPEKGVGLSPRTSEQLADAAIELINRRSPKPLFLHVNFTAPHDPLLIPPGYEGKYDPRRMRVPANFRPEHPFDHGNLRGRDEQLFTWPRTVDEVRKETAAYYAVISHMDRQIGRIMAALAETGQADNTIVIFASDQGVALGSHGLRGKQNMYEHTIAVPLIVRCPGGPRGAKIEAQCYLRDLYPTVCELANVPVPASVEGRSLVPLLRGGSRALYQDVYAYYTDTQRTIRTDRWKLIYYPKIGRVQLFDLTHDPDELHDASAAAELANVRGELAGKLAKWQEEVGDTAPRTH